ncbi:hypothetical protein SPD48_15315 [Pseudogracilibacillus sp. SE30717A]|uniref:hypothetical protein n=1 Tax=Pseudogracilibacillus sp. SE30717A TaxID=3098293 RepID=UPI00300E5799
MTELECEINKLEEEMDEMLCKSAYFKGRTVTEQKIFRIEKLRNEINSKAENAKANHLIISIVAVFLSVLFGNNVNIYTSILGIIVVICWIILTVIYKRRIELDTKGLGLIDMLLERKKELELRKSNLS